MKINPDVVALVQQIQNVFHEHIQQQASQLQYIDEILNIVELQDDHELAMILLRELRQQIQTWKSASTGQCEQFEHLPNFYT